MISADSGMRCRDLQLGPGLKLNVSRTFVSVCLFGVKEETLATAAHSENHCPFERLIVFQNAINYMHTFTHFTRFFYDFQIQLHIPVKFVHESHRRKKKKRSEINIALFLFLI